MTLREVFKRVCLGAVAVVFVTGFAPVTEGGRAPSPSPAPDPCFLAAHGSPESVPTPAPISADNRTPVPVYVCLRGRDFAQIPNLGAGLNILRVASAASNYALAVPAQSTPLTFEYAFGPAARVLKSLRKRNGVPLTDDEDRLGIILASTAGRAVTIWVNAAHACMIASPRIVDQQVAACKATASAKTAPGARARFNSCDQTRSLCGQLTIGLAVLQTIFTPQPGAEPLTLSLCYGAAGQHQCQQLGSQTFIVDFEDAARWNWRTAGGLLNGQQGGSDSSASASLRRFPESRTLTATTDASGGDKLSGLATAVHSLTYDLSVSLQFQNNALISAVNQQTQQGLAEFAGAQAQFNEAGSKLTGTATNSDDFRVLDADILNRIVPTPFRGFDDHAKLPKNETAAFDSTDLIDLKPFDPSKIKETSYGGKITWLPPTDAAYSVGFYRDDSQGAQAAILHADVPVGGVIFGFSRVSAHTDTQSNNPYITQTNTTNTVLGAVAEFGRLGAWQAFSRYAHMSSGSDRLFMISYAPRDAGTIVRDDGSAIRWAGLLGYRTIDSGYAPLATGYNPFSGLRLTFGRADYSLVSPGKTADQVFETSISGARGANQTGGYSSVGASIKIPLTQRASFSIIAAHSIMGASVAARQTGVLLPNNLAQQIFNNDTLTIAGGYSTAQVQLTIGASATHSPSCNKSAICSSPFSRAITGSLQAQAGSLNLSASIVPGSQGKNSTAGNQIVRTVLSAYHVCDTGATVHRKPVGVEGALTFKNNISEDTTSFVPGHLLEADVDMGTLDGFAIRFSLKNVHDAAGNAVPITGNLFSGTGSAISIGLVSNSQTIWKQFGKIDHCNADAALQSDK